MTQKGKLFTMFLVVFGIATGGYAIRTLAQLVLEGQLRKYFGRKSMEKSIRKLKDHFIVCGFGRVGKAVCEELSRNKVAFAVIEIDPELVHDMEKAGCVFISGNSHDDETLLAAGIERAKGLINTVANEADAVYVTISARQLNPDAFIMARADSNNAKTKLLRAGASRVISPHVTAGIRMAQATLKPAVVDFMSLASDGSSEGMKIEEIVVKEGSNLAKKTLKESGIRFELGITVIGARKKGMEIYYNPPPDYYIDEGDTLILVGAPSQMEKLETFCSVYE